MGCGSSSLKGEKVNDPNSADAGPPARRVQTNFSEVDFSGANGDGRRGTMAVAPDEDRRPTKISESSIDGVLGGPGDAPKSPAKSKNSVERARLTKVDEDSEGAKLEPYKSLSAEGQETFVDAAVAQEKQKNLAKPDLHMGGLPPNDEAAAMKTVGTEAANPMRV